MLGKAKRVAISEIVLIGIIIVFLITNFERNLGGVALALMAVSIYMILSDNKLELKFQKEKNVLMTIVRAVIASIVFFVAGPFLVSGVAGIFGLSSIVPAGFNLNAMLSVFSETKLAFAGSLFATIIALGIIIPLVETQFFGRALEYIKDRFNIKNFTNLKIIPVLAIVLGMVIAFHITAKLTSPQGIGLSLLTVSVFFLMNLILILITGQLADAALMHIITNTVALLGGGLNTIFLVMLTTSVAYFVLISSFTNIPFLKTKRRLI